MPNPSAKSMVAAALFGILSSGQCRNGDGAIKTENARARAFGGNAVFVCLEDLSFGRSWGSRKPRDGLEGAHIYLGRHYAATSPEILPRMGIRRFPTIPCMDRLSA